MRPTKLSSENPVTVQDAIVETIHRSYTPDGRHIPPKAIAENMNLSGSVLYDIADEHRERKLRAEEIPALVRATGNPLILVTLARAVGGAFIPLPTVLGSIDDDYRHASDALEQFGQTMQAYATAFTDGRVTTAEARKVEQEGNDAITAILSLMAHAKEKASGGLRLARERGPA